MLAHSRQSPRYLRQATAMVQDGARDHLCYVMSLKVHNKKYPVQTNIYVLRVLS